MEFFNGREEAQKLENLILARVKKLKDLKSEDLDRKLLILLVGDSPESLSYTKLKLRLCDKHGIPAELFTISSTLSDVELTRIMHEKFLDDIYSSVIVQLPLPRASLGKLLTNLPLEKDIDGLNPNNVSVLTPIMRATNHFIKYAKYKGYFESLDSAAIIGRGTLVGIPLEKYLKQYFKIVNIYDREDNVTNRRFNESLVVLSTGVPNLITGKNLVANTCVIDFGSTILNGKTTGDLDLNSDIEHLGLVSPSPRGMGPLVVRYLVMNHLRI